MKINVESGWYILYTKRCSTPKNIYFKDKLDVYKFFKENLNDIDFLEINSNIIDIFKLVNDNYNLSRYLKLKRSYEL